ncbi:MAG: glycosyltransferase [Candidatus Levybacteria bacterium]|nr:glycosyltransferase [Candidatus Levybacteria bacterium]
MKRIAMLSMHTCPLASKEGKETGGMNVYVLELSKELSKRGFVVDVYTRVQNSKEKRIVQVDKNFRVIHLTAGPESPISKKKLIPYAAEFANNFLEFAKKEGVEYDIMHCHYYLSGLTGTIIQKKLAVKIPRVMMFHTLALMKNLVARDELENEGKDRIKTELQLTREVNAIIAASDSDRAYLTHLYDVPSEKITVINPGVNNHLFRPIPMVKAKKRVKAAASDKIVLFVGRIEPLKGIDMILYALKIMLKKNQNLRVCLWIIGGDVSQKRGWTREVKKLEELRKTLNIEAVVKFLGRKKQYELPYFYNASEFVVMPSHYESFGMAALEAMACGVPVITTNVAGIASLFDEKHDALLTSVNNPLDLASKMEFLLTNQKEREKLTVELQEKVQDLTWGKVTDKIIKVYSRAST